VGSSHHFKSTPTTVEAVTWDCQNRRCSTLRVVRTFVNSRWYSSLRVVESSVEGVVEADQTMIDQKDFASSTGSSCGSVRSRATGESLRIAVTSSNCLQTKSAATVEERECSRRS